MFENSICWTKVAARERPAPLLHPHVQVGQELVADAAVEHVDAGLDAVDRGELGRRADEAQEVGELDRRGEAGDRAERRGEVHSRRSEGAGAARALRTPVDPALAGQRPVDEGDHAERQGRELLGLVARVEADAGDVEIGMAAPAVQRMGDGGAGDRGAGLRIVQPASRVDDIVVQRQAEIVGDERVEARGVLRVGDGRAAADHEIAALHAPVAGHAAKQQGHVGELAAAALEPADHAAIVEAARERGEIEPVGALRAAEAERNVAAREAGTGEIEADLVGGEADRRFA